MLLCHDDELEGRRIAFIFYLVPEWTKKDGGECIENEALLELHLYCGEILSAKIFPLMW